ncbi:MAG: hypothetical protein AAF909_13645 [Pseudomonadota bacterium]
MRALTIAHAPTRRRSRPFHTALAGVALILSMSLSAAPVLAEPQAEAEAETGTPLDRKFFEEQLLDEDMRAAIEELVAAFGPVFNQFSRFIEDIPQYETPEILPNGDILIRRKKKVEDEIDI